MFKKFFVRKMLERQLGGMPADQRAMVLGAFEKDPDFFMRIAKETEEKTKAGMDKHMAAQQVFMKHAAELRKLMGM